MGSTGTEAWNVAVEYSNAFNTSVAEALARDYPPVDSAIIVCPNGKKTYEYYRFEFPLDLVYNIANTSVIQANTSITVTTDTPIQIQIVDLRTGLELIELSNVYESYTFDMRDLEVGCVYSIVMRQYVEEAREVFIIRTHNFCKLTSDN